MKLKFWIKLASSLIDTCASSYLFYKELGALTEAARGGINQP